MRLDGTEYEIAVVDEPERGVATVVATPTDSLPLLAVYGDSYSVDGPVPWAPGSPGWARLVARRVGMRLEGHAVGGTGWVHSPDGISSPFLRQTIVAPATGADVVVLFGSINDHWSGLVTPDAVRRDVALALDAVRTAAPRAGIVVVGPQWPATEPPPVMAALRDAVRAGCTDRGVRFVDALRWLAGRYDLIWTDNVHPTAAGLELLASLIEPEVRAALP